MNRPTIEEVLMGVSYVLSLRAACQKRQVGCVLTDSYHRIVGTGYNGRPRGMVNCCGADACTEGCEGVHAEINALLQCDGDDVKYAYVTHAPCWHCVKALINTSCTEIFFVDDSTEDPRAKEYWLKAGGHWTKLHRQLETEQ